MATLLFLAGGIIHGDEPIDWFIAPLPPLDYIPQVSKEDADAAFDAPAGMSFFAHLFPPDEPQDGELQDTIDHGGEVQDYQDYLEDIEFFRRGC